MMKNLNRILSCGFTLAAVLSLGMAGSSNAQVPNGGFEDPDASAGDVPCSAEWDCVYYVSTTARIQRSGAQALRTKDGGVRSGGAWQTFPGEPGQTFVGEIYAMNASRDPMANGNFGGYSIQFRDANGDLAAGGVRGVDIFSNSIDASAPLDEWQLLGVSTAPAPDGTAFVWLFIGINTPSPEVGGSVFWDDASLELADPTPALESTWGEVKRSFR